MRFVLYNIRYATGTGPAFHLPIPGAGYLRSNTRVLERLTAYLKSLDPDLVGLIEVDTGSIRTGLVLSWSCPIANRTSTVAMRMAGSS